MDPSYNNLGGFGTGGAVAPVSFGTGDIVLAPEKKSNKKMLIMIIVILMVGGLFAVLFFIFGNNGKVSVDDDSKLAFNRYANYLLYGNDSDMALNGEYDENGSEMYTILSSEDSKKKKEYANKLDTLWHDFSGAINNFNINSEQTLNDYSDRVGFVVVYLRNDRQSMERKMLELILDGKGNTLAKTTENYLGLFSSYNFEEGKAYQEAGNAYYSAFGETMTKLNSAGCLGEDGDVVVNSDECLSVLSSEEDDNNTMESQRLVMEDEISKIAVYLEKNCWGISNVIGGGRG